MLAATLSAMASSLPIPSEQRHVTVAVTQFACSDDISENIRAAEVAVRDAARRGANIVLLQELFASRYFPIDQRDCSHLAISQNDLDSYLYRFQQLARVLNVVLPISFFERSK